MTLHLSLSPEAEELLRQRAKAAGLTPEEYARRSLEEALHASAGAAVPVQGEPTKGTVAELLGPGDLTPAEAQRQQRHLEAWLAMARPAAPGTAVDDSRDSIYDGRGE